MPRESSSLRLSSLTKARIAKICELLDVKSAAAVDEAVIHFLTTLELRQATYRVVPSEHSDDTQPPYPPARRGA